MNRETFWSSSAFVLLLFLSSLSHDFQSGGDWLQRRSYSFVGHCCNESIVVFYHMDSQGRRRKWRECPEHDTECEGVLIDLILIVTKDRRICLIGQRRNCREKRKSKEGPKGTKETRGQTTVGATKNEWQKTEDAGTETSKGNNWMKKSVEGEDDESKLSQWKKKVVFESERMNWMNEQENMYIESWVGIQVSGWIRIKSNRARRLWVNNILYDGGDYDCCVKEQLVKSFLTHFVITCMHVPLFPLQSCLFSVVCFFSFQVQRHTTHSDASLRVPHRRAVQSKWYKSSCPDTSTTKMTNRTSWFLFLFISSHGFFDTASSTLPGLWSSFLLWYSCVHNQYHVSMFRWIWRCSLISYDDWSSSRLVFNWNIKKSSTHEW